MYTHDVLIIGSGPAGSTAAYDLARRGLKVCILEKEKLPRYKTCGGGVQVKAANLLPFSIEPVVERTIYGMQIGFGMRRPFIRYYDKPLIYMTMRDRLDYFLAQQAAHMGAELRDEMRVDSLAQDDEGVTATCAQERLRAKFLIGADGAKGITARTFGLMQRIRRIAALEAEVEIADSGSEIPLDCARIDWGTVIDGYAWTFPKGEVLSMGAATPESGKPKAYYERYQRFSLSHTDPTVRRFSGHPIPLRPKGMPIHSGRVLLAGDAAGLVDSFSGEGIYYAIRSGQLAAEVLYEEAGRQLPSLERYAAAVEEAITPELESGAVLAHVFRLAGRQVHGGIHYSNSGWNAFCEVLRGQRTYRDLVTGIDNLPRPLRFFATAVRQVLSGMNAEPGLSGS